MCKVEGKIIRLMRLRDVRQEGDLLLDSFRVSIVDRRYAGTVKEISRKQIFEAECRITMSHDAVVGKFFSFAVRELMNRELTPEKHEDLLIRFLGYRLILTIFEHLDSDPGGFDPQGSLQINIGKTTREEIYRFVEHLATIPHLKELKRWSSEVVWVPDVDWNRV